MSKKVFIIGTKGGYQQMFEAQGWEMAKDFEEADLIQFTGGEDVTPSYYKQAKHPSTYNNEGRDKSEKAMFDNIRKLNKPMAGICRGGQFLHVMNGGSMYQDSYGHAISHQHKAYDVVSGKEVGVTSTHHQIMKNDSKKKNKLLLLADGNMTTHLEEIDMEGMTISRTIPQDYTVESIFYPESKSLCFQPHPEFSYLDPKVKPCADLYFSYLEEYLGV